MSIAQRLGESDADYEARKKRVRRTRQGVDYGLAHAGGGGGAIPSTNVCVIKGTDGTWQGAERATTTTWSYGEIIPLHAVSGQLSYAIKWKTDGTFVLRLGNAGDEIMPDVNLVVLRYTGGYTMGMNWNATEGYYDGVDISLAAELDAVAIGEKICFDVRIVPNLFISYNFNLERGTA